MPKYKVTKTETHRYSIIVDLEDCVVLSDDTEEPPLPPEELAIRAVEETPNYEWDNLTLFPNDIYAAELIDA